MDNIYTLADPMVAQKIGGRLKSERLKQNITQKNLAEETGISLSTLKKIREIGFVFFSAQDVVRHCLLEKIITAYTDGE